MNVYQICLRSNSEITQLPDSQKVFGALIYTLSEKVGEYSTTKYVAEVRTGVQKIALSGVMPEGYLPTPRTFFEGKYNPDSDKETHKTIKKQDYILKEDLFAILKNGKEISNTNYVSCSPPYLYQQIRVGIDGDYRSPGLPNNIFSVPKILCREFKLEKDPKRVADFCFFVQAEDNSPIIELLKGLEKSQQFILGKRSSQGFNIFSFVECRPYEISNIKSKTFLNTGMLLPRENIELADFNSQNTALTLFTSERRPFEMGARWNKSLIKSNYISFIAPGSMIALKTDDMRKQVGRSIGSPFSERAIIFGNAFLYPVEVA